MIFFHLQFLLVGLYINPCLPSHSKKAITFTISRTTSKLSQLLLLSIFSYILKQSHFLEFKSSPNVAYSRVLWAFCNVFQVHHQATKTRSYGIHLWLRVHKISKWESIKQQGKAKICSIQHKTRLLCHLECPFVVGASSGCPSLVSLLCLPVGGSYTKWRCIEAV